jgi:hypothetical protein
MKQGGTFMRLRPEDWGRFHAYPRLVEYIVETPHTHQAPPCSRLIMYLRFAKIVFDMSKQIDSLSEPANAPGPRLADQYDYREQQVADLIATRDPDLLGMLVPQHLSSDMSTISQVYARTVVGSEDDANCDLILSTFRRAGFRVPAAGTCR